MNAKAALLGIALAGYCAASEAPPMSSPIEGQLGYDSEASAAYSALAAVKPSSHNVEYAGAIYRTADGLYHYTQGVRGEASSFKIRFAFPKSATVTALYHTHPGTTLSRLFSPLDVETADRLNVHSYVGDLWTDTIIEYIPHESATFDSGRLHRVSYGIAVSSF